jgi:Helix-turn-helix domain
MEIKSGKPAASRGHWAKVTRLPTRRRPSKESRAEVNDPDQEMKENISKILTEGRILAEQGFFYSEAEAATILGVSVETVIGWRDSLDGPHFIEAPPGAFRISLWEFNRWVSEREQAAQRRRILLAKRAHQIDAVADCGK